MEEKSKVYAKEISTLIGESWKSMNISAGITAGLFDELSLEKPVSIEDIINKKQYSTEKLELWFNYMTKIGIVKKKDHYFYLTQKGLLFSKNSPFKDLLGLFQITDYFMQSAVNSKENFKTENSQDTLTKGKLSNDYQSKVTDNLSMALVEIFKSNHIGGIDSLLDLGCGNGNLLREIHRSFPFMKLTGVDQNVHAIERGNETNVNQTNKENEIKFINGNVLNDMKLFPDKSQDWVTGINLFHFIKSNTRMEVINNMMRICRKGIFFTETVLEASTMSSSSNPLLTLLWNDFTGFFSKNDSDKINNNLVTNYKDFELETLPIIQGTSNIIILKNKWLKKI